MNIVIVGTAYPMRGSMAQLNAALGWHLAKQHNVELVSFTRQYPQLLFPGTTQLDPGKPVYELPTTAMVDSVNPFSWFKTARAIAAKKPDAIIMRYWIPFLAPCLGVIARRVKRLTGATVLFICDNVLPHERRPGDAMLTRFALRAADVCIVQSHAVKADLHELLPAARSVVAPHPIYNIFGDPIPRGEARRALGLSESERVLLFFGYVRRYKGLDILLDAMPSILRRMAAKLLVVGEFYEDQEKYERQIMTRGLQPNVQLRAEYVRNEEIATYFSAADLVVLPYRSATQSGIVQIAYHFNKPVVATRVGGLGEVIIEGKTGFLVSPESPDAIADAVVGFFEQDRDEEFARNIEAEKKNYNWERFIERVEEAILRARSGG